MSSLKPTPPLSSTPVSRPHRNVHIECNVVQEEAVLYDPLREQVYALNHSAYLIWQRCDGVHSIFDMANEFSKSLGMTYEELLVQITSIVDNLSQLDLLYDSAVNGHIKPINSIRITHGDHQVHIHTDSAEVKNNIIMRFKTMITDDTGQMAGQLGVYKTNKGYTVTSTRVVHVEDGTLAEAIRAIKHETVLRFIEAQSSFIWLHAGAISKEKGAIIFGGPWETGKSMLVTPLYEDGWFYLSDDVVPLDGNSCKVNPFPLTPAAQNTPEKDFPAQAFHLPKKTTLLKPGTLCSTPQSIRAIIFPKYVEHGSNTLEPCAPGLVAAELIKHCQNIEHHKERGVRKLCKIAASTPGFNLHFNNGPTAASKIADWYNALKE